MVMKSQASKARFVDGDEPHTCHTTTPMRPCCGQEQRSRFPERMVTCKPRAPYGLTRVEHILSGTKLDEKRRLGIRGRFREYGDVPGMHDDRSLRWLRDRRERASCARQ